MRGCESIPACTSSVWRGYQSLILGEHVHCDSDCLIPQERFYGKRACLWLSNPNALEPLPPFWQDVKSLASKADLSLEFRDSAHRCAYHPLTTVLVACLVGEDSDEILLFSYRGPVFLPPPSTTPAAADRPLAWLPLSRVP